MPGNRTGPEADGEGHLVEKLSDEGGAEVFLPERPEVPAQPAPPLRWGLPRWAVLAALVCLGGGLAAVLLLSGDPPATTPNGLSPMAPAGNPTAEPGAPADTRAAGVSVGDEQAARAEPAAKEEPAPGLDAGVDFAPALVPAQVVIDEDIGFLRLQTTPPTAVYLAKRLIGSTPVADMKLPPGKYKAVLVNEEEKIRQVIRFTIRRGEVTSLQYFF